MSILNVAHRELQHSNFLGWLFDPTESHNKEDYFLREFIKLYYKENNYEDLGNKASLSVFDFVKLDLTDAIIQREHKNIDLLITSESNELIICIENKIHSKEGKGQLTKYRTYIEDNYPEYKYRIYIYLSLFEQEISEGEKAHYVPITYEHIIKILEQSLLNAELANNVEFVIKQYIISLRTIMNENPEIEQIAKDLYKEYKSSFDLVWKYITPSSTNLYSRGFKIPNSLVEYIANDDRVVESKTNPTYIRFKPVELMELKDHLIDIGLIHADYDLQYGSLFWFEFEVNAEHIRFYFNIGPYDNQDSRQRLFDHLTQFDCFNFRRNKLAEYYTKGVSKDIVSKQWYIKWKNNEDEDALEEKIKAGYENTISKIIPDIMNAIKTIN